MTTLINRTPHTINEIKEDGTIISHPSQGNIRVKSNQTVVRTINGTKVYKTFHTVDPAEIPQGDGDVIYLVSLLVLQTLKSNGWNIDNFLAPDTSPASAVRNEEGQIIGVKAFTTI